MQLLASQPSPDQLGMLSVTMISFGLATFLCLSIGRLSAGYGRCIPQRSLCWLLLCPPSLPVGLQCACSCSRQSHRAITQLVVQVQILSQHEWILPECQAGLDGVSFCPALFSDHFATLHHVCACTFLALLFLVVFSRICCASKSCFTSQGKGMGA